MQYGSYAVDASKMDALCRDVNRTTLKEGELPDLPSSVFEAWRAEELNKPALRVLALGTSSAVEASAPLPAEPLRGVFHVPS